MGMSYGGMSMTQSSSIIAFPVKKEEKKKTRLSADEIETNREKTRIQALTVGHLELALQSSTLQLSSLI